VVVTLGPKECETMLRAALATGADRAIRIEANDNELDGRLVAAALKAIVDVEKPDLILLGKQAVDGDSNQVGQRLAELIDYPMATFAATIKEETGALLVGREVDGGVLTLRVTLPAVVTVDLRIISPTSVYSKLTQAGPASNTATACASHPCPQSWPPRRSRSKSKRWPTSQAAPRLPPSTSNSSVPRNAPAAPKSKTWPSWSKSSPPFRR